MEIDSLGLLKEAFHLTPSEGDRCAIQSTAECMLGGHTNALEGEKMALETLLSVTGLSQSVYLEGRAFVRAIERAQHKLGVIRKEVQGWKYGEF